MICIMISLIDSKGRGNSFQLVSYFNSGGENLARRKLKDGMGPEAKAAKAPWRHRVACFDDAQVAVQSHYVDGHPHPARMYT
jgi:hypothetical protein